MFVFINFNYRLDFFIIEKDSDFFIFFKKYKVFCYFKLIKSIFISNDLKCVHFFFDKWINFFYIKIFFFSWFQHWVKKIKFRHKITWFRMSRRYKQFIKFNLGLSHYTYLLIDSVRFFRKKKYLTYHNFVLWSINYYLLKFITLNIKRLQPINMYTQRGFRFSRDLFPKHPGKASTYAHLKSKLF